MDPSSPTSAARALTLVHTGAVTRRSELTQLLGLTRTGVGTVLRELDDLHLVRSGPAAPSGTGRPSHAVTIHPDAPVALAVQVRTGTLLLADAGLGGRLGPVTEVPLPRPATPGAVLDLAATLVAQRVGRGRVVGAGIALPSAVGHDGTALAALNLGWPATVPVAEIVAERLAAHGVSELPVHVANDGDLGALAESRHGAGRGAGHLLYLVTGERGVGGGLVVGGRTFTGGSGYALEVGHLSVAPGGRPCHCGNAGCLEVETDPAALLDAAGVHDVPVDLMPAAARALVTSGDPAARAAVDTLVDRLGEGLAALVNVLNPDRVVLGGLHADLLAAAGPRLREVLRRRSFLDQAASVDLRPGTLPRPELTGAGELALQPLLDDPRGVLSAPRTA